MHARVLFPEEFQHGVDDRVDFVVAEVRVEREREDLGGGALCDGECGVWVPAREEWLLVEQVGVVNQRLDAAVGEVSRRRSRSGWRTT